MNSSDDMRGILWLKLSPASQEQLKSAYPPRYNKAYYHHVTLLFDVSQKSVTQYVGKEEQIEVYAHSFNDRIEAVRVHSHLPDTYGVPHITLSARPNVAPFESVAMLRGEHTEAPRKTPLLVSGVMEFVPLTDG